MAELLVARLQEHRRSGALDGGVVRAVPIDLGLCNPGTPAMRRRYF
jgi:hypothetical protein